MPPIILLLLLLEFSDAWHYYPIWYFPVSTVNSAFTGTQSSPYEIPMSGYLYYDSRESPAKFFWRFFRESSIILILIPVTCGSLLIPLHL